MFLSLENYFSDTTLCVVYIFHRIFKYSHLSESVPSTSKMYHVLFTFLFPKLLTSFRRSSFFCGASHFVRTVKFTICRLVLNQLAKISCHMSISKPHRIWLQIKFYATNFIWALRCIIIPLILNTKSYTCIRILLK